MSALVAATGRPDSKQASEPRQVACSAQSDVGLIKPAIVQAETQFGGLTLLQQTQPRPTRQVVGVDRMADRFDAEKTQAHRAVEQVVIAAGGLAFQFITELGLLD